MPDIFNSNAKPEKKDLFSAKGRKAWKAANSEEARCDFAPGRIAVHPRGVWFVSMWKKSIKGRRLSEIKQDDEMVGFFAESLSGLISAFLGPSLSAGGFAMVTTPARRHKERNFAERTAEIIAANLGIPFYTGCATAKSRQRVNAVFEPANIPAERNIIVFDDIVTTGSTFKAMDNLLKGFGKNCIYFAGINNST